MDEILRKTLLFDFYGDLLTTHQKNVYENIVFNDFSISEVARDSNISRQSVHEMIRRCNELFEKYENTLHLVEKFEKNKDGIRKIKEYALKIKETTDTYNTDNNTYIDKIIELSDEMLDDM